MAMKLAGVELVEESQAPLGDVFGVASTRVGERLHRARVDKGLELADIARDTRVPLRHLIAIESDSHENLPALTYSIGFVKTFARAVGLPQEEIANQFKAETTKAAHVPQALPLEPLDEARLPPRGIVAASAVGVIAIVAAIWASGAGLFQGKAPPPPVEVATPVDTAAPASAPAPEPTTGSIDAQAAAPVSPTGDIGVPPVTPADAPVVAPIAGATVAGGPVVLTATQEVWIKVYDAAQQTVKMGILQPGEAYTVPADRGDLQLWTGRAGALRVTVGGRPIPPLGGPQETVQGVSLNPAALAARGG